MIKQFLFNLSKDEIFFNFIDIMGYLSYPISTKKQVTHSYTNFIKSKNFLNKKQHQYKHTSENLLIETVFNLKDAKLNLLNKDILNAQKFLKEANKTFSRANNITSNGKKMFEYTQQLMGLEIDCIIWFNEVENKIGENFLTIEKNKNEINNIFLKYKNVELNSPEHLELSKRHLELVMENIYLDESIKNSLTKNDQEEGMQLLHRLKVFKNRMIDNDIIQLENNFLKRNKSNAYNSMLYLRACAEATKIKFYLQYDKKELFDEVNLMVKNQVTFENFEPLKFYNNTSIKEIFSSSPYAQHYYFNKYINSFTANIKFNNDSNVSINLKQIENIELIE